MLLVSFFDSVVLLVWVCVSVLENCFWFRCVVCFFSCSLVMWLCWGCRLCLVCMCDFLCEWSCCDSWFSLWWVLVSVCFCLLWWFSNFCRLVWVVWLFRFFSFSEFCCMLVNSCVVCFRVVVMLCLSFLILLWCDFLVNLVFWVVCFSLCRCVWVLLSCCFLFR